MKLLLLLLQSTAPEDLIASGGDSKVSERNSMAPEMLHMPPRMLQTSPEVMGMTPDVPRGKKGGIVEEKE